MWIIEEPKKVALWNKRHFEEKNGECAACLKYSVLIFDEKKYIKCNVWRVAVRPSYIWDARFLKVNKNLYIHINDSEIWNFHQYFPAWMSLLWCPIEYPLTHLLLNISDIWDYSWQPCVQLFMTLPVFDVQLYGQSTRKGEKSQPCDYRMMRM